MRSIASSKNSPSLQLALLADALIFVGIIGISPNVVVRAPTLAQGGSMLFGILLFGGFGVAVLAAFTAICERKWTMIALVFASGFLSCQLASAAIGDGDKYWSQRFWSERDKFAATEKWIAALQNLEGLERIQVEPPEISRRLATGGEIEVRTFDEGRFVVVPAHVYGIDNAVAYIHSANGRPPPIRTYWQIVHMERLDAHWYLVRTT